MKSSKKMSYRNYLKSIEFVSVFRCKYCKNIVGDPDIYNNLLTYCPQCAIPLRPKQIYIDQKSQLKYCKDLVLKKINNNVKIKEDKKVQQEIKEFFL